MGHNLSGENSEALIWLEARIDQWQADPISIGLTQAQADDLAGEITAARDNLTNAHRARDHAIGTTAVFNDSADTMRAMAAPLIANIKNFADNASDPISVYSVAKILPRKERSPVPAPTQPNITALRLGPGGSVTVAWKATGATGTIYNVVRKLDTERTFSFAGQGSGRNKQFIDKTIPAGAQSASYMVQGVRGDKAGPLSNAIVVQFGTLPSAAGDLAHSKAA